jgi:hypothetical protein
MRCGPEAATGDRAREAAFSDFLLSIYPDGHRNCGLGCSFTLLYQMKAPSPNHTLERTQASRVGRAGFVSAWRLARAAHGDR